MWPDMMTPWAPAPADPLRLTILAALACAAPGHGADNPPAWHDQPGTQPETRPAA